MKDMMWEALFQRAHEDDYGVLLAILSVKSLVHSPSPERVFKLLTSIIFKGINRISAGLFSMGWGRLSRDALKFVPISNMWLQLEVVAVCI